MTTKQIKAFQKRLDAEAMKIFVVLNNHGEITNLYETEAAAMCEIAWWARRHQPHFRLCTMPLHTLSLSKARWQELLDDSKPAVPCRQPTVHAPDCACGTLT